MKLISSFLILGLLILASCTAELPTMPLDDSISSSKAAQGDRSEWQMMLSGTIAEGEFATGFLPCLNNGQGESAWFVGSYAWLYKRVVTPSGNTNDNVRGVIYDDTGLVGITTGDYWKQVTWNSQFPMHTRRSDGLIHLRQVDNGWLVNESTGDRVKILYHWNQVLDEDWNLVSDDSRLVSCTRVGGR